MFWVSACAISCDSVWRSQGPASTVLKQALSLIGYYRFISYSYRLCQCNNHHSITNQQLPVLQKKALVNAGFCQTDIACTCVIGACMQGFLVKGTPSPPKQEAPRQSNTLHYTLRCLEVEQYDCSFHTKKLCIPDFEDLKMVTMVLFESAKYHD